MGPSGGSKTGAISEVVKSDSCEQLIVLDLDDKFTLFASVMIDQKYHHKLKIITPSILKDATTKYHKITDFFRDPRFDFENKKIEYTSKTLLVVDTISGYKDYAESYYRKFRAEDPAVVGLNKPVPIDKPYSWLDWGQAKNAFNSFMTFSRDFNGNLIVCAHVKEDAKITEEDEKLKETGKLTSEAGLIYPSMVTLPQSKEVGKYFDAIWWVGRNGLDDYVFVHKSKDLYNKLNYNASLKSLWLNLPGILPAFRDAITGKLSITSLVIEDIPRHEAGVRQLWDAMQSLNK